MIANPVAGYLKRLPAKGRRHGYNQFARLAFTACYLMTILNP